MILKPITFILALISQILFSHFCYAQAFQSHAEIRLSALNFVRSQIPQDVTISQIKANKIDSRIKFKQCSQALVANATSSKNIRRNWTIRVQCNDEPSWNIYMQVKTLLTRKIIISNTTVTRGELLTQNNVQLMAKLITNQSNNYFTNINDVIGREARRTIRPNKVIKSSMLQKALLVRKKEPVLIYAKHKGLQISVKGTALSNGYSNQMIKVRNNSSHKIIDAIVVKRGVVAINF